MIEVRAKEEARVCQGDIIRDVEYYERVSEEDGILEISRIVFPLVIVLTQDCDLAQDHLFRTQAKPTQDKWLISALVAPLYNTEHVVSGEHLSEIGVKSEPMNKKSSSYRMLKQNQNPRYHYLEFDQSVPIVPQMVDFKHYFSVPIERVRQLKAEGYVCSVSELYREDISHRFASFLSRIGLPDPQEQTGTLQENNRS